MAFYIKLKKTLSRLHWILSSQFGIDPLRFFLGVRGLPRYISHYITFRRLSKKKLHFVPCLSDWYEEGGVTKSEYFWQDLLVARAIYQANPIKHVDIGSRVDGFVAHVASFREIEVFDVRPISSSVPGIEFKQVDCMQDMRLQGYCDSLSCLHALEHFGLGRYGDPIDPLGYQRGIVNMVQLLRPAGTYYLSTPIGEERVEFNANWVFDPRTIIRCAEAAGMVLQKLIVITPAKGPQESLIDASTLADLALQRYQLGLFVFTKVNNS